jgi:hypothetical protein
MTINNFLHEAERRLNPTGHYIQCPDCEGEGGRERYCELCGGAGCPNCNLGLIFLPCTTCKGEKEIFIIEDELEAVWHD